MWIKFWLAYVVFLRERSYVGKTLYLAFVSLEENSALGNDRRQTYLLLNDLFLNMQAQPKQIYNTVE